MTNNKRARENERRRQAEYARKQAEIAAQRKQRARRIGLIVGIAVAAVAVIVLVLALAHANGEPDAAVSSTEDATTSADPTADATADASDPTPSATESDPGIKLAEGWGTSPAPPDPSYADARDWTAVLATDQGDVKITLNGKDAPQATAAFIKLAGDGYYDATDCHDLSTEGPYFLQCGTGTGTGAESAAFTFGPLENVPADGNYKAGDVVMVRQPDDAESMSSQFQIIWKDSTLPTDSAGGYTVVGEVTSGLSIVEGIAQAGTITGDSEGWPAVSLIINEVTIQ